MSQCLYCKKEIEPRAKVCPHCSTAYPFGRSFFTHPVVVISWGGFSAFGIWLTHSFTPLSMWLSILLVPIIVALLFVVLVMIGD